MNDLAVELADRPGSLGELGRALGAAGVSVEGGGMFVVDGRGIVHFLVHDGARARRAVEATGLRVLAVRDVLQQRLRQEVPGQLGLICSAMAEAGVNIEVMYSDHDHQLVLVVDDHAAGQVVSDRWTQEVGSA